MMTLIFGSNGSGKSVYAESLVAQMAGPRYYIATMVAENEENRQRIEKHRRQRAGLNFQTVEEPWQVGSIPVPEDAVVLLEDASNLMGNVLFAANGKKEQALEEILRLRSRCKDLLVVAIGGLCPDGYDGETAAYIRDLCWLHDRLLEEADRAVELRRGEVIHIK